MSEKTADQKCDLQPRKKKRIKRKANSPLNDCGQIGHAGCKGQNASASKNSNNNNNN